MAAKCVRKRIVIKKGRKVVADFMGHTGSGCGPRPKPKTGHLREAKALMKKAAPQCARVHKPFTKPYGNCIRQAFKSSYAG